MSVLPYLEGGGAWLLDRAKAWDEGENRLVKRGFKEEPGSQVAEEIRVFTCPAGRRSVDSAGQGLLAYVGVAGVGVDAPELVSGDPRAGLFGYDQTTRPAEIKDGMATTVALVETSTRNGPWKAGGFATLRGLDPDHRALHREGSPVRRESPGSGPGVFRRRIRSFPRRDDRPESVRCPLDDRRGRATPPGLGPIDDLRRSGGARIRTLGTLAGTTVFKTVASPDATLYAVKCSHRIIDRKHLHFPYGPSDLPPDLSRVVAAWPTLPEPIRAGILAMVGASISPRNHRVSDVSDETRSGRGTADDRRPDRDV